MKSIFGGTKVFQLVPRDPTCHRWGFSFVVRQWRSMPKWTPLTNVKFNLGYKMASTTTASFPLAWSPKERRNTVLPVK
jgi:hypothetical protein